MKKTANIKSLLTSAILLLFSWFWIASALFTHLHVVDGQLSAHSHPYTSNTHSHSTAEFFGYQQFSSFEGTSNNSLLSENLFAFHLNYKFSCVQQHINAFVGHSRSLRAPPVISFL